MNAVSFLLVLLIVLLDQILKYIAIHNIGLGTSIPILKNILHLTPALNTGGGFGILQGKTQIFILVSTVAIIFIIYLLFKERDRDKFVRISLVFILSGAIGNIIDRVRLGSVVDFIDFRVWPIFNIADSFITIGTVLLGWWIIFRSRDGRV